MPLTWKDTLAAVFVGLAVVLLAVSSAGAPVTGISGRGPVVAILVLGIGGCYTAQSHFETVYGVNGTTRPPLAFVVLVSAVGAFATMAGIVAVIIGGTVAVTTLLLAMVVMWILATFGTDDEPPPTGPPRRATGGRRSVCAGDRRRRRISRRWCPG